MFDMILFAAIVLCFALVLIAWSVGELFRVWQAGVLAGFIYLLGVLLLLVRVVANVILLDGMTGAAALAILCLALSAACAYLHFRLIGTMIAPLSAALIVALVMGDHVEWWQIDVFWMPMVTRQLQPWGSAAIVLAMIGLGLAVACLLLALPTLRRLRQLPADEATIAQLSARHKEQPLDEAGMRALIQLQQSITLAQKMPRILSHLVWWALAALSFSLGAYVLWCHTLYGVYWLWQPLFALASLVWIALFIGKDMLFSKQ